MKRREALELLLASSLGLLLSKDSKAAEQKTDTESSFSVAVCYLNIR